MRTLVESIKRLYDSGKLTKVQIADRVQKGSISAEEYVYITGEEYSNSEDEKS